MRAQLVLLGVACLILGALAAPVSAAPSLPITKPPVMLGSGPTGPAHDPPAMMGQWFSSLDGTEFTNRTNEFYDNVQEYQGLLWGGGPAGSAAIKGIVNNVQYNGPPGIGNITAFTIQATITNDTPGVGPWRDGANSHGETLSTPAQYAGPLQQTKLTAEFACDRNKLPVGPLVAPYWDQNPRIFATGHDELAWYCWAPGPQTPTGDYYVPTWDFGDIQPGQTVTRLLSFTVDGAGLPPSVVGSGDYRYAAIQASYQGQMDIFFNRTTDLKIGDWMETLLIDGGTPYADVPGTPPPPEWWNVETRSGNVSVFHNVPEPGSLALCLGGAAAMGLLLRRRFRR